MLIGKIRSAFQWLRRAVTQPREELGRWERAARSAYELGRYGARQLEKDRAPQMAAALAFRTLFSLAPVLVVTTIMVKAFRGSDAIARSFGELLSALGLDTIYIANVAGETGDQNSITLATWLQELVAELMNMNLTALTWVGLALILYAAIGLMVTIENSFNLIFRAPEGRSWINRILLYWFILTMSPAMLGLATYVHDGFTDWIASVPTWQWLLVTARTIWGFCLAWLMMLMVYVLLPNCTVRFRPAIIGSFIATLLLAVGRHSLGAYLGGAFSINQLYGVLGLVPLFMFWVYLMWLAVLFGLQVAATLQALRGRDIAELAPPQNRSELIEPSSVLTIMEVVAEKFTQGKSITDQEIANSLSLPANVVDRILEQLIQDGWVHRLQSPEGSISLAQPPDQIRAEDVMKTGFGMIDDSRASGRVSSKLNELREAQREVVRDQSLASLMSKAAAG